MALAKSPVKPVVNEPVELSCTLFNSTAAGRMETVYFDLPGISGSTDVQLPPFGTGIASRIFVPPQTGCVTGTIRLRADAVVADNTHYFKVCARDTFTARVIGNSDFADPRNAAFFISKALAPFPDTNPGLRVVNQHNSSTIILEAYFLLPCVFLV